MKKFILFIGLLLLLTIPVFAASPVSLESAINSKRLNEQDKSKMELMVQHSINSYDASTYILLKDNKITDAKTPLTYDYDHTISWSYVSNPNLITTYGEQGNLKSNLRAYDGGVWLPVIQDGIVVAEVAMERSGDSFEYGGGESVDKNHQGYYDSAKNIEAFRLAGITSVNRFEYVSTGMYDVNMFYVDTDKGEYAIPYTSREIGLTNGKVYKVSDIIQTLEKNFNLEKEGTIGIGTGALGGFNGGGKSDSSFLLSQIVSLIAVTFGIALLVIIIRFIKRYKAKKI